MLKRLKIFLKHTRELVQAELELVVHEKAVFTILLIAPIAYGFFYGSVYWHKAETDIPIAVVDHARSDVSRNIIDQLDAHQLLSVEATCPTLDSAQVVLHSLDVFAIIELEADLTKNVQSGRQTTMPLYVNSGRFLIANDIVRGVNETIGTLNAGIRVRRFQAQGMSPDQAMQAGVPIDIQIRNLGNPDDNYGHFFIPGLLMVVWQQTLLISFGISMAHMRETQKLGQVYRQAGRSWSTVMFGKSVFYLVLYLAYAFFFMAVMYPIYKMYMNGHWALVTVMFMLQTLVLLAFCTFTASFFKEKVTALQVFVISSYPFFLISGFAWPKFAMPGIVKMIANLVPHTPFFACLTRVTQLDAGLQHVYPELIHMVILLLVYTGLSYWRLSSLEKN